jgi:hypothetical protein
VVAVHGEIPQEEPLVAAVVVLGYQLVAVQHKMEPLILVVVLVGLPHLREQAVLVLLLSVPLLVDQPLV